MTFLNLRLVFDQGGEELFVLAGRAFQIVEWDRTHLFCGRCGEPTEPKTNERARLCPACGQVHFPRLAPAVIMAVIRDRRILLAHANRFPSHFYSVLAGFVEPGETFEECVAREVEEEVGIKVKNIRYLSSQPWPFPHSLMVGFIAEHDSGEINVDGEEIRDADWFAPENLPQIPGRISIARRLIDWFVEEYS